jgi:hypothetical protein
VTEAQKNELLTRIQKVVQETVKESVANSGGHVCLYFTPEEAEELGHYWGMVRDIGEGDRRRGIETMRENHIAFLRTRRLGQKLRDHACFIFIGLITAGLLTTLWQGIKMIIQNQGTK